ncbi:PT domain-containing protein [Streptomyces sp. NPDC007910]|uniref:PT domain-containing protein n=1 Tax=Streptomyces sp. NPDC007910 TaxID=3364790 RepID=UPI0036EA4AA1
MDVWTCGHADALARGRTGMRTHGHADARTFRGTLPWTADRPTGRPADRPTGRPTGRPSERPINRPTEASGAGGPALGGPPEARLGSAPWTSSSMSSSPCTSSGSPPSSAASSPR